MPRAKCCHQFPPCHRSLSSTLSSETTSEMAKAVTASHLASHIPISSKRAEWTVHRPLAPTCTAGQGSTQTSEPKPAQKCRDCHFHCFSVSETDFMLYYLLTCCRYNLKYLCHLHCTPLHACVAKWVILLTVLRTPWLQQCSHLSST